MTSIRGSRNITYRCDKPGCGATYSVPTTFYDVAWKHAKSQGWVTAALEGKWFHFCSWVHRPNNDEKLRTMLGSHTP